MKQAMFPLYCMWAISAMLHIGGFFWFGHVPTSGDMENQVNFTWSYLVGAYFATRGAGK